MVRPAHYSPAIDRQIVCALYHEARRRHKPMTRLVNDLLAAVLRDTHGWQTALDQCTGCDPHRAGINAPLPASLP
jgi:hypothetical protein